MDQAIDARRLVCLGDSFTEGMCDERRADGEYRGWADRVAESLAGLSARAGGPGIEYANLAVRGKLLDQVIGEQVEPGLAMDPTILTFHAGPNDVLRTGMVLRDLLNRYEQAVAGLAAPGRTVVLFTAIGRAGGTGRLAQRLADRFGAFNEGVRHVADRHGARLVDLERVSALSDRRMWFEDRLHLNEEGHRRVAAAVLDVLGSHDSADSHHDSADPWWEVPLPVVAATPRHVALAADAQWVGRHLVPWVGRRLRGVSSGDGRAAKDPVLRHLPGEPAPSSTE